MSWLNPWGQPSVEQQMQADAQLKGGVQTQGIAQSSTLVDDQVQYQYLQQQSDFNKWTQDLSQEEEDFIHSLRRDVYDEAVDGWVRSKLPPLLNDRGVAMILEAMKPCLSKNLINTNLDDAQTKKLIRRVSKVVNRNLAYNYDIYEMDRMQHEHIVSTFITLIEATAFRCLNDGERHHVRSFTKVGHSRIESTPIQMQNRGVLGMNK